MSNRLKRTFIVWSNLNLIIVQILSEIYILVLHKNVQFKNWWQNFNFSNFQSKRDRSLFIYGRGGGRRESIMKPKKSLAHFVRNKNSSYPTLTSGILEKSFTPLKPILLQSQRSRHKIPDETVWYFVCILPIKVQNCPWVWSSAVKES
jgi:hypothetical protein